MHSRDASPPQEPCSPSNPAPLSSELPGGLSPPTPTKAIAAGHQNLPTPTSGELFRDGAAIELVADRAETAQLNLLVWSGTNGTVGPRAEHSGRMYCPPTVHPSILRGLRLPTHTACYGSTGALFADVSKLFTSLLALPEQSASRLTFFVFGSWFPDCLPTAPNLRIVSSLTTEATLLLRLLHCLCRRPLLLSDVTPAGFCSLPMHLCSTVLIEQQQLSARTERLLVASNSRGVYIPHKGTLLDVFCAKAFCVSEFLGNTSLANSAIQIAVTPTHRQLPILDEQVKQQIANEFQPKLLAYRLTNHRNVRESRFDVPQFTSPTRNVARSLGRCIIDAPELQCSIVPLLDDQDEQVRLERSAGLESIVLEAVLALCHEGQKESAYVHQITFRVNAILRGRGETLELEERAVGDKLRSLGLFTRRLGSAGRGILLLNDTRRRVHQLAHDHDVRSVQDGVERCPHCREILLGSEKM